VQSFALLNAYTSATTTFDANNKKLFSWSNTYRSNALINDEVDGSTIYKNGLATPLPISMTSGVSSANNTNLLLAKTNYAPVINSTNASAKVTGLTEFLGDSTFASNSYNRLIANQTSDAKNNGIIDNYNE
jgi:hypothetical protein